MTRKKLAFSIGVAQISEHEVPAGSYPPHQGDCEVPDNHLSLEEAHFRHLQHAQCPPPFFHCLQMFTLGIIFFSLTAVYFSKNYSSDDQA
jgi:hypothetical protein